MLAAATGMQPTDDARSARVTAPTAHLTATDSSYAAPFGTEGDVVSFARLDDFAADASRSPSVQEPTSDLFGDEPFAAPANRPGRARLGRGNELTGVAGVEAGGTVAGGRSGAAGNGNEWTASAGNGGSDLWGFAQFLDRGGNQFVTRNGDPGAGSFGPGPMSPPPAALVKIEAIADAAEVGLESGSFLLTRTGIDLSQPLTVYLQVSGTATSGLDYEAFTPQQNGILAVTIAANEATATIDVTPLADSLVEEDEAVDLLIVADAAYQIDTPDSATVTIADVPNLPPVIDLPDAQTTALNTSLTFSTANSTLISVSDPDAGSSVIEFHLLTDNGTLTLAGTTGLTFTVGDGTSDADLTFQGTLASINAALDGLTFAPTTGYTGPALLLLAADDLGNTGAGGAQSDVAGLLIGVGGALFLDNDEATTDEDVPLEADVLLNYSAVYTDLLALTVVTGPAHGTVLVHDNDTPTEGWDDYLVYTPDANYHGTDQLTYQVNDGHSNVATATLDLIVESVNDATLLLPADRGNQEGELVSLFLETPDNSGNALTFTATGLPAGLTINAATGEISGRAHYDAADTNGGAYSVTVTASFGSDSDSQTFHWYIDDTNRLSLIDDKASRVGEYVSFVPFFNDLLGNSRTFSATGLPSGVSIDPNMGWISGIVGNHPAGITEYTTTVTATGGGDTDERTFKWQVLSGSQPHVLFAINGTLRHEDDVTLVDPQLPLSVTVTLYAPGTMGPQTVQLLVPSGLSSLSASSVQLLDGQSATLTLTPLLLSTVEDEVVVEAWLNGQLVGAGQCDNLKIEIKTGTNVNRIRAATTPAAMTPDRIPPRVQTPYSVTFVGPDLEKKFAVTILGQSEDNGRVKFRSANPADTELGGWTVFAPKDFNGTYAASIVGQDQTKPGNAGQLKMAVFRDGEENDPAKALLKSAGFSVSAIPIAIEMRAPQEVVARVDVKMDGNKKYYVVRWGAEYHAIAHSDSGDTDDLDLVEVREQIKMGARTGYGRSMKEKHLDTSDWQPAYKLVATKRAITDKHTWGEPVPESPRLDSMRKIRNVAWDVIYNQMQKPSDDTTETGPGKLEVDQYFQFNDQRATTDDKPIVVDKSGFRIKMELAKSEQNPEYTALLKVTKTPHANNTAKVGIMNEASQAVQTILLIPSVKE